MQLSTLKIERFGARSNLQLIDISNQLNVVYGPNGSGKTTTINFIRWMLYGNADGSLSRFLSNSNFCDAPSARPRYETLPGAPVETARAYGELTLRRNDGYVQRITRQDDGSAHGRVSIADSNGVTASAFAQTRMSDVDIEEFRTIFSFGFDQSPSLETMIQTAGTHGWDLSIDERRLARIQQLTQQLSRQRNELSRYAQFDVHALTDRRTRINREIAQLQACKRERLADIERQRSEILAQIEQRRSQLSGIQSWLQNVDATIQARRAQLETAAREASRAQDTYDDSRRRKVEDIDRQIQKWHETLEAIRTRYEELKSKNSQCGSSTSVTDARSFVDDDTDLRCLTGSLGYHVDDLEQDLAHLLHFEDRHDVETKYEYVRGIMGTALQAMRTDVTRLGDQLRMYKTAALQHEYESELRHLRRCEQELNELVISLSKRRDSLSRPVDNVYNSLNGTISPSVSDASSREQRPNEIRPWYESPTSGGSACDYTESANGVPIDRMVTSRWTPAYQPLHQAPEQLPWQNRVDPVLEARLYHLQRRRDQIVPRVNELEVQVRELESRLACLDAVFSDEDRRIEILHNELQQVDEQVRLSQDYDRMVQAVRLTEDELATLQSGTGSSEIMREASAIFRKLTCGEHNGIRIVHPRQIVIDTGSGPSKDYQHVSRGTQDQAYLAVAIALVSAYKRRNVQHPLILNDVFINTDERRGIATAQVLSEFANQGFQVILFTRHERVTELFEARNAKLFTLGSLRPAPRITPRTAPVAAPVTPVPTPTPPIVNRSEPKKRFVEETRTDWVSHWEMPRKKDADRPAAPVPPPVVEAVTRSVESVNAGELPEIETSFGLGSPLDTVPTIDVNLARQFRDIGVVTIGQFLELDPDDATTRLSRHRISAAQIARWQSDVSLQVYLCIPGENAQILVECGISDPEDLAVADLDHLHNRVNSFLSSEEIRSRYGSYQPMTRELLSQWIETARRSNYRRRQRRVSNRVGLNDSKTTTPSRRRAAGDSDRDRSAAANRRRDPRVPIRPRSTSIQARDTDSTANGESETSQTLKFYLNLDDPIVDAPSIGPKTAERFHAIGINTLAEFLAADPVAAAEQINYRRITAEIIAEWQIQAKLATQIPNLRGHDAQILAACEVTDADELTRADASTLYKRVKRFVGTTEGKRILRNGKRPDQNEVSNWIRWSHDARQLEAA